LVQVVATSVERLRQYSTTAVLSIAALGAAIDATVVNPKVVQEDAICVDETMESVVADAVLTDSN